MNQNNLQNQQSSVWLHEILFEQYNRGDSVTIILFPLVTPEVRKALNRQIWAMEDILERPLNNLEEAMLTYKAYSEVCEEPDSYLSYALEEFIRKIQAEEGTDSFLD